MSGPTAGKSGPTAGVRRQANAQRGSQVPLAVPTLMVDLNGAAEASVPPGVAAWGRRRWKQNNEESKPDGLDTRISAVHQLTMPVQCKSWVRSVALQVICSDYIGSVDSVISATRVCPFLAANVLETAAAKRADSVRLRQPPPAWSAPSLALSAPLSTRY